MAGVLAHHARDVARRRVFDLLQASGQFLLRHVDIQPSFRNIERDDIAGLDGRDGTAFDGPSPGGCFRDGFCLEIPFHRSKHIPHDRSHIPTFWTPVTLILDSSVQNF